MKHRVLYRWKVKPGHEDAFRDAWATGTLRIRETCKSGGAELFSGPGGLFLSLARWPSEEMRSRCLNESGVADEPWAQTMNDCIAERLPEIPLSPVRDLRKGDKEQHRVPILCTERLTLRPLALSDASALFAAFGDEATMRYWSRGPLESVSALAEYMTWNVESPGVECFAIAESENVDDALGWIILIDRDESQAELGFILRPDARGRGLAREAIAKVVAHGFETRKLRRLYADIDPDNKASIAAVKSQSFSYEGHLRATWKTHLGVRDSLIYARLCDEAR